MRIFSMKNPVCFLFGISFFDVCGRVNEESTKWISMSSICKSSAKSEGKDGEDLWTIRRQYQIHPTISQIHPTISQIHLTDVDIL